MLKKHFELRCAVYLVLVKDNKLLIQRRYKTGWMDGRYSLIAGHLEGGETAYSAMVREAKEETGIDINQKDLKVIHVLHRKSDDNEYIDIFFKPSKWQGVPRIIEKDKSDGLNWVSVNNLPKTVLAYVRQAISCYLNGVFFSEFGFAGEIY